MIMQTGQKALSLWNESIARLSKKELWSTGLLVASSAILGGIAVALWNRRSLAAMREADLPKPGISREQVEFFEYE